MVDCAHHMTDVFLSLLPPGSEEPFKSGRDHLPEENNPSRDFGTVVRLGVFREAAQSDQFGKPLDALGKEHRVV